MTRKQVYKFAIVGIALFSIQSAFSTDALREEMLQKKSTPARTEEKGTEYFIKYHPGKKELEPGTKLEVLKTDIFKGKTIHYGDNQMWFEGNIFSNSTH